MDIIRTCINERGTINREELRKKYNNTEKRKKRIRSAFLRMSLMAMLLIVSTYAWFTSQKDITLSNIRGTVEVVENMEISLDAKTWYQRIDLSDAINTFAIAQTSRDEALNETDTKSTALTILPEQLLPVSGAGEIASKKFLPMYVGEATSTSLSAIEQCLEEKVEDKILIINDKFITSFEFSNPETIDTIHNINKYANKYIEKINRLNIDIPQEKSGRKAALLHLLGLVAAALVKTGVAGVEIAAVKLILGIAQGFAKPLIVDDLPLAQVAQHILHIRVIRQMQQVFVGGAGLLLCCQIVREFDKLIHAVDGNDNIAFIHFGSGRLNCLQERASCRPNGFLSLFGIDDIRVERADT